MPIGYVDEASQDNGDKCGAGVILKVINESVFKLSLGCGKGTNTRGELLALWCLFCFAHEKHFTHLQVVGDSKVIID